MKYLVIFLGIFIFSMAYYYWFVIKNIKKYDLKRLPSEALLFIKMYDIDVKKVGLKRLLLDTALMYSLEIPTVVIIVSLVDNLLSKILLGIGLVFIFIILGTYILSIIYKKKGWVKQNE